MMRIVDVHPVAEVFKRLGEAEHAALRKDIVAYGQARPIALYDGMVWDGRERFNICEAPKFSILRSPWDAIKYVLLRHTRYGKPNSKTRIAALKVLHRIVDDKYVQQQQEARSKWKKSARRWFKDIHQPTEKMPCAVCNKHAAFVHAHHLLPLAIQFELGIESEEADHSFEWLCPVHHKYVHMMISVYITQTRSGDFLDCIPDHMVDEWTAVERVFKQCSALYELYGGAVHMYDAAWDVRTESHRRLIGDIKGIDGKQEVAAAG
jgi:hypothetical protein